MENNETSNTNTILIVLILVILVGFVVWWFARGRAPAPPAQNPGGANIQLNLPNGGSNNGGTTPAPGTHPGGGTSPAY